MAKKEAPEYPCHRVMKLEDIVPASWNPRKIAQIDMDNLRRSVEELGNLQPITFNVRTKNLIGGCQRLRAFYDLKRKETDVWCVDLPAEREELAAIALNNTYGSWDDAKLVATLRNIQKRGQDIAVTGFDNNWMLKHLEERQIPTVEEALFSEIDGDATKSYDDIGWLVVRCPSSLVSKLRDAIQPIVAPHLHNVQIETNQKG